MSGTMDPMATDVDQQELAQQLLAQSKEQGIELVGPGGLLNQLTKNVLETALEAEMDEHLGYGKHDVSGRGSGNSRNGSTPTNANRNGVPIVIRSQNILGARMTGG